MIKTGVALIIVEKSENIHLNEEELEVLFVEVILPGRDDLFYEAIVTSDNDFFNNVATLE